MRTEVLFIQGYAELCQLYRGFPEVVSTPHVSSREKQMLSVSRCESVKGYRTKCEERRYCLQMKNFYNTVGVRSRVNNIDPFKELLE